MDTDKFNRFIQRQLRKQVDYDSFRAAYIDVLTDRKSMLAWSELQRQAESLSLEQNIAVDTISKKVFLNREQHYASKQDRLINFKDKHKLHNNSTTHEYITTLLGFVEKHIIAILDMLQTNSTQVGIVEFLEEHAIDVFNYSLLAKALIQEHEENVRSEEYI